MRADSERVRSEDSVSSPEYRRQAHEASVDASARGAHTFQSSALEPVPVDLEPPSELLTSPPPKVSNSPTGSNYVSNSRRSFAVRPQTAYGNVYDGAVPEVRVRVQCRSLGCLGSDYFLSTQTMCMGARGRSAAALGAAGLSRGSYCTVRRKGL